eukprot:CAMPEP_0181467484 /NCGR_PEP_ID=MMETSP1110-20121109/37005_1 /TAXON_ID=174948 /ORGANISM="Symbiodinium sp., Strain CCMP421" /LENGTH=558 /DNA_ID=CAMNT_0023592317 /DNA_START=34 /DNA_END=1710 /DNA_ORIENTATION=-
MNLEISTDKEKDDDRILEAITQLQRLVEGKFEEQAAQLSQLVRPAARGLGKKKKILKPKPRESTEFAPALSVTSFTSNFAPAAIYGAPTDDKDRSSLKKPEVEPVRRGSSRHTFVRSMATDYRAKADKAALEDTDSESEPGGSHWQEIAAEIATSHTMSAAIMALIAVNMILMGVEVDVSFRLPEKDIPPWFNVINLVIVIFFVLEIALKLVGVGPVEFFCGSDRGWNVFDFFIILISVLEATLQLAVQDGMNSQMVHVRAIRFVRIARALRGIRVLKLLKYVSALRGLIFSIASTMASLMWTLVLLLLVFYSFAVIFTQIVSDHCRFETVQRTGDANAIPECSAEAERFFASVPETMLTLFMSISAGVNWNEPLGVLREISYVALLFMIMFIVITVFAVMNVVTGVFCNTAIESAHADKEIAVMIQIEKQAAHVRSLQSMFNAIDTDNSTFVNYEELKAAMESERLASFLESMEIETHDVLNLFRIIDADENGLIDLNEFVSGCMQLHGPAKSIQMAQMSHENKLTRRALKTMADHLTEIREKVIVLSHSMDTFDLT